MKRAWFVILCAVIMTMTAACGGSQQSGSDKASDAGAGGESSGQVAEIQYQEFSQFGLIYELPEGTEETHESDTTYTYPCDGCTVEVIASKKVKLSKELMEAWSEELAGEVNEGEASSVKEVDIDGSGGYQFDLVGKTNDGYRIMTATFIEAPQHLVQILAIGGSSKKSEYAGLYDALIASVKMDPQAEVIEAEETEQTPEYYVKKRTAVTKECTIKITDYKVLKPGEGPNAYGSDTVIVFYYDMTNTAGKKMTPAVEWPIIVDVIQDNDPNAVNRLQPAILIGDDKAGDSLQEIKPDGTVSCSSAYTLTDTTTPVELTFHNGTLGEDLGTMTFKVK